MDSRADKHGWNIDARTFEPRLLIDSQSEENIKLSESDTRSNNFGATSSSKSIDNGCIPYYQNNNNDLIAQITNQLRLTSSYELPQYYYFPNGCMPTSSFPTSMVTNIVPDITKSPVVAATHSLQQYPYNNPFLNYNRINHSPYISLPYVNQQSVPNITNAAGRSRRNSCMVNKVFNTGDPQIDNYLTELYKIINPRTNFDLDLTHSRFFVIKSYTEEHVHRSIKYSEWCSTQRGNDILDKAYRAVKSQNGHIYLFFSVNSSGYFCGVAEMQSEYDSARRLSHWNDDKWQGGFLVKWLYVKDVPNKYLKHIILEYNDNRPITNSRDATEIKPAPKGIETLRLMHEYHHNSSLFDDFDFYETKEKECFTNMHHDSNVQ